MRSTTPHTGTIGTVTQRGIPAEVDVAVVGSGGAGLIAALTAAKEGARVLVVESRELVGGATGISAGAAWVPNHGFSTKELGVEDDLDQARRYIYGQGRDQVLDHDLVEKFLETGPEVARYIEANTSFGWIPTVWPDYRSDIEGASVGRALFPGPYSPAGLGDAAKFVRPALTTGMAKNPSRSGCSVASASTTSGSPGRPWWVPSSRPGCATVSMSASRPRRPGSSWTRAR